MDNIICNSDEWVILTSVGPILFHVYVDSTFFGCDTQLHIERHTHSTYEIHIILGGSGTVHTDEDEYEISAGSYYIVKAGVYHKHMGSASDPIRKCSLKFEFDLDSKTSKEYSEEEIRNIIAVLSNIQLYYSSDSHSIKSIIDEIKIELTAKTIGYYAKAQHLFSLLFIQAVREIANMNNRGFSIPDPRKSQENRNSIIDTFFDSTLCCRATSQDLCKLIHTSSSQLNRILHERYSMTYKQKQIETRIERIKDMLINTDMSVGEISEAAGYASECNFSTFFKHVTGMSPKTYRKNLKKT